MTLESRKSLDEYLIEVRNALTSSMENYGLLELLRDEGLPQTFLKVFLTDDHVLAASMKRILKEDILKYLDPQYFSRAINTCRHFCAIGDAFYRGLGGSLYDSMVGDLSASLGLINLATDYLIDEAGNGCFVRSLREVCQDLRGSFRTHKPHACSPIIRSMYNSFRIVGHGDITRSGYFLEKFLDNRRGIISYYLDSSKLEFESYRPTSNTLSRLLYKSTLIGCEPFLVSALFKDTCHLGSDALNESVNMVRRLLKISAILDDLADVTADIMTGVWNYLTAYLYVKMPDRVLIQRARCRDASYVLGKILRTRVIRHLVEAAFREHIAARDWLFSNVLTGDEPRRWINFCIILECIDCVEKTKVNASRLIGLHRQCSAV